AGGAGRARNKRAMLVLGAGVLVLVVVVALWDVVLWSPRSRALHQARAAAQAATGKQTQLEAELARLKAEAAQVPAQRAELAHLHRAVPTQANLAAFMLAVNKVAHQSHVDFLSISPTPPAAPTPTAAPAAKAKGSSSAGSSSAGSSSVAAGPAPSDIKLAISGTGTFPDVLSFVERLDNLSRLVVIDSLDLSGGGTSKGASPKLNLALTAQMYTAQGTPSGGTKP
ncbi:MAG: hypothetical protein ACRD0L_07895, partial [Acidimicrobiales bacterium]